jgi:hypothetical protein
MSSGIVCLANLFELILNDPVKYHVVQSAINASLQPSTLARLHELSKPSIFKDLLQEAKLTDNHANAHLYNTNGDEGEDSWRWYKFDPEEPDPAPPQSCRYDDPYLYEDMIDDTEAQQDGGSYRVCAAQVGVSYLHASHCTHLHICVTCLISRSEYGHYLQFISEYE